MLITKSVCRLSAKICFLKPVQCIYLLCSYPWIRALRSWKPCWWQQGRELPCPWRQCPGWWRTWRSETWWRGSRTSVRKEQRVGNVMRLETGAYTPKRLYRTGVVGRGLNVRDGLDFTVAEKQGQFPTRSVSWWGDSAFAISDLPGLLPAWVQLCWVGWLVLAPSDQCSNFYTLARGVQRHSAYNRNTSSSDFVCAKAAGSSHSPEGSPRSARKHFTVNGKPWQWHFPLLAGTLCYMVHMEERYARRSEVTWSLSALTRSLTCSLSLTSIMRCDVTLWCQMHYNI